MIDLLVKLIAPIAESMGAEASMVEGILRQVEPQVNVICYGLLAAIALLIAVHWIFKKGNRHPVRWTVCIAWVLIVLLMVNQIAYGAMKPLLSAFLNASKAEISEATVEGSQEVIQEIGEEGMVLLKNDGLLPLTDSVKALNVFGWASTNTVFSGTGSAAAGEANVDPVTILKSLANAGYETNADLTALYTAYRADRPAISMNNQDWTLPEPTADQYSDELINAAKSFSDTALIVIGRSGGENADLPTDMNAVIHGTYDIAANADFVMADAFNQYGYFKGHYTNNGDYDDFEPEEHYLELSRTEEDLVALVTANFEKVVLVVNANNPMELGWINDYPQIKAVILAPGTGASGMAALGEILNGSVNPSGKTVDTYVYDLTKAPTWNNSGNSGVHIYSNYEDVGKQVRRADISYLGTVSFVDYVEGIYQGYKFYETAAEEGLLSYDEYVQFPFGYGLSYTSFRQEITSFNQGEEEVTVEVKVTNSGSAAGKDVVELYCTPPYTNGGIEKASVNLVDFEKTSLLEPGESETVTFHVKTEDLASYDSNGIKVAGGGYILEAGEYSLSVRSDSHTVLDAKTFTISSDVLYPDGRASDKAVAVNRFGYAESKGEVLSRKDGFANYAAATAAPDESRFEIPKDEVKLLRATSVAKYDPKDFDNADDIMPATGADNGLKLADLTGKDYDDPDWDKLLDELTVNDMVTLVNNGGWNTAEIESIEKVRTSDCDGPSGLSNYLTGAMGTQFPTEVLMAQTWSKEIAYKIGVAMAREFADAGNYGWYGPAMNLHRFAFAGRNFEYYSEDPVLSGKFASVEVNAAAELGVYPYIKHFAANDQETNRCAFLMTYLPEQALRENVLKPFELVVKNFDFEKNALAVMSSYNWLGTVPVVSNRDLLTTVLREEWGFKGMVISDFDGGYGYMLSDAAVRAGNDLMLATTQPIAGALDTSSATLVKALRQASKNILYVVANSGYYRNFEAEEAAEAAARTESSGEVNNMDRLFGTVNTAVIAVCAALLLLVWLRWFLKKKKAAQ